MVLSYKNNELSSTYNWGVESLDLMGNQFVTGNLPSYVAISKYLFERMQFQASADLAHRTLAKVCNGSQNQYKKILLNNAVLSYRAADQNKKIISLIDIAEKCGLPENITQAAEIEYLDSLREKKFWVDLLNRVETTQKTGQGRIAVYELEYLLDMCLDSNNHNGKYCAKLNAAVDQVRSRGDKLVGKSLDAFAYIKAEEIWKNIIIWQKIELKFPEKVFNDLLAKKLKMLEKIVEDLLSLQKMGSRLGINQSFEMLAYTYHKMAIEVDRFVPTGVSKEYVDSFRASMKQVSSSLKLKLADYKKQSLEITSKQDSIAPFKGVYPVAVPIKDRADFQVVFGGAY